jgi:hypothetical protein
MHLSSAMTLRIAKTFDGQRTILKLSGRIQSANVEDIREQMTGNAETIVLDLEEVTLVDLDVVRFLHPNRFGAVATLPGLDADGAIAEIGYALDTLKTDGVTTTTSINDAYLGEPQFDPWLDELNRRSATFFVHPTITKAGETLLNGLNASVIEFMFDTTRMITNMVATGAKKRFSQIKNHTSVLQLKNCQAV